MTNGHAGGSEESLVVTGALDWRCNGHFPISQLIRRGLELNNERVKKIATRSSQAIERLC